MRAKEVEKMAHNKVYGICESKCRVEVIPASKLHTMQAEVIYSAETEAVTHYPDGFDYTNCVLVGFNYYSTDGQVIDYGLNVTLEASGIKITSGKTYTLPLLVNIVLLKI